MSSPLHTPETVQRLVKAEEDLRGQWIQIARDRDRQADMRADRRHIKAVIEASVNPNAGVLPSVQSLTPHEKRRYSVTALLQSMLEARHDEPLTLEREVSMAISKDIGTVPQRGGYFIPLQIRAGLDTKTNAAGGYLAETQVKDIVDALVQQSRCLQLGAQFMTALKYSQQFPTESNVHQASWVSENPGADVTASDPSFGAKTARPHALASSTSISRQLLAQATQSLEGWLRSKIARSHAIALDAAAIGGSGTANQPVGLLKTAGIGDVAVGVNGGPITAAHILSMEAAIATANADSPACAWLTVPAQRTKLRSVLEIAAGGRPIWRNGRMLDYGAYVSNEVPSTLVKGTSSDCAALIFADWSQLLICEFSGAIEVVLDPYTLKRQGQVELASWAEYDVLALQPAAFVACQDAR